MLSLSTATQFSHRLHLHQPGLQLRSAAAQGQKRGGGAVFSLIDEALTVRSVTVAMNVAVNYRLPPGGRGAAKGEASEVSSTKRTAT